MLCWENYLACSDFQNFFWNESARLRDFGKIISENRNIFPLFRERLKILRKTLIAASALRPKF